MAKHLELGKLSEALAAEWFLQSYPSRLVAKNYRCKFGELDLIFEVESRLGIELVIVEVRVRTRGSLVDATASIGPKKLQRIQNTIRHFLLRYNGKAQSVRLDVLAGERSPTLAADLVPPPELLHGDVFRWTHLSGVWV